MDSIPAAAEAARSGEVRWRGQFISRGPARFSVRIGPILLKKALTDWPWGRRPFGAGERCAQLEAAGAGGEALGTRGLELKGFDGPVAAFSV